MMAKQVGEVIHELQQTRGKTRRIRNIVSSLMVVLNIPEGNHLVMLFGDGHEKDNREALATWVTKMSSEIDLTETENRLETLCLKAKNRIEILGGYVS